MLKAIKNQCTYLLQHLFFSSHLELLYKNLYLVYRIPKTPFIPETWNLIYRNPWKLLLMQKTSMHSRTGKHACNSATNEAGLYIYGMKYIVTICSLILWIDFLGATEILQWRMLIPTNFKQMANDNLQYWQQ